MAAGKKEKLEQVITTIQARWGTRVIGLSSPAPALAHIPSGFAALDSLLGTGGWPRGRISELMGVPTSGMATLGLRALAAAQDLGGTAVYIDLDHIFDADYARRCGVALAQLTVVRPPDPFQALAMLPDFFTDGSIDLVLFDLPARRQEEPRLARRLSSALGRLLAALGRQGGTLLFLTTLERNEDGTAVPYPSGAALPHYATLRLLLRRERWLYQQHDIYGYETEVLVLKNKLAAPGGQARLTLTFDDRGDKRP